MTRPRVLVIAEAANPEWVSVPLVGYSLANALRDVVDAHLVTQIRNRAALLRAGWREGEDFTAIDSEALARPMRQVAEALRMGKGKGWTMTTAVAALSYPYFERLVWRRFGPDIAAGRFDVVHRVTPLTPTAPSPIARRCRAAGVPFVLGPLNGGIPWPPGFGAERRREQEWLSYVRGAYKLLPGRFATLENASVVIAGSHHTLSEIPARFRAKSVWMPENGIDTARFGPVAAPRPEPGAPLRACFIGRLVPYKGPDMLLEAALPFLREGRLALDIVGDGPLMPSLRETAAREGVGGAVRFHGWVAHADVPKAIAGCALFAFPSVREFGGGAVLEAMALGIVPMIVDYAGPGELVDDATGFKVPLGRRPDIVKGFRAALEAVLSDPNRLPAMAEAARAQVLAEHTWARKARKVAAIYDRLLAGERSAEA